MSTEWFFRNTGNGCNKCKKKWWQPTEEQWNMFVMLKKKADDTNYPKCDCGQTSNIYLNFEFGLSGKILHCFYPSINVDNKWLKWKGRYNQTWEYYPFLVVVDPDDKKKWGKKPHLWFPYWHVVGKQQIKKYGQWAQCLPTDVYLDLLGQARKKKYAI